MTPVIASPDLPATKAIPLTWGWSTAVGLMLCFGPMGTSSAWATPWEDAVKKIRMDPPPREITRGHHYVSSDERRHDLFKADIENIGGVFVGVGTNQNYLMAGWAKPEAMVIVDFDIVIKHVHDIYRVIFLTADTPEEFLRLWTPNIATRKEVYGHINESITKRWWRTLARQTLRIYGREIFRALKRSRNELAERGIPSFLSDAEQYNSVRKLYQDNRVLTMRGDFTGWRTMRDIGGLLAELGLEVNVLYLSNIEQYIGWRRQYRANLLNLPLAQNSKVLRAYGWGRRSAEGDGLYRYYVQTGPGLKTWVETRGTRYVTNLLGSEQPGDIVGLHHLTLDPAEAKRARARPPAKRITRGAETAQAGGARE